MLWKLQGICYTLIALRCMLGNTHCKFVGHHSHKASGCCIDARIWPAFSIKSHISQVRLPTLTCGSFNHICSQLRLENQVSCGLHITATLSPVHQHAQTFASVRIDKLPMYTLEGSSTVVWSKTELMRHVEKIHHRTLSPCDIFLWVHTNFRTAFVTPKSASCCQSTGPAKSRNSVWPR